MTSENQQKLEQLAKQHPDLFSDLTKVESTAIDLLQLMLSTPYAKSQIYFLKHLKK